MESNKIIYVDHSATTFVKDEVLKEMLPYFKYSFGNPSSVYSIGRKNKEAIEKSRVKVSNVLGCKSNEIYFEGQIYVSLYYSSSACVTCNRVVYA